ncbi:sensor histidine kinase [Pseudoroseicyclus tamaricis]|uniref:histidine kinase n=1 Tax=Pseudoroseicyclus tamaricis TaxID=2705421 RepID=A0A6B2JSP9_9RHOB|nr:ATP-binding protein [Pseudoroseicyclus tamaricis]NDV01030.1 PAS domain S-box protein [Pseudoroseicyclus tamaricis]
MPFASHLRDLIDARLWRLRPLPWRALLDRLAALSPASLHSKLAVLVVAASLFSALPVAWVTWSQASAVARDGALRLLEAEATLVADRLETPLTAMMQDAAVLAATPPIRGIIRAGADEAGRDPVDGSSLADWQARLETIFVAMVEQEPTYTQVRYITLADGGRELVRVGRAPPPIKVAPRPVAALGDLGDAPEWRLLAESRGLAPFYTEVTTGPEETEAIRAVQPVADATGAVFGAIVIDGAYESLLAGARAAMAPGHRLLVDAPAAVPDGVAGLPPAAAPAPEGAAVVRVTREVPAGGGAFTVTAIAPIETLLAPARAALRQALVFSAVLVALALVGALLLGFRLTAPLRGLKALVTRSRELGEPVSVPPQATGEIGELARAFRDLTIDLVERTERAQAVLAAAADGILIVDDAGIIRGANPALGRIFGQPAEGLIGQPLGCLLPEDRGADHAAHLAGASFGGTGRRMAGNREVSGLRASGETFPAEVTVSETSIAGRRAFIGLVRDISRRKADQEAQDRLVAELRRAKADLERSNDELESFAYVASHDLKAPLRVIDNASRWLEEDLEAHLNDDTRESMDLLRGRVARMERLLDDLLEHSRIGRVSEPTALVTGAELMEDVRALAPRRDGITLDVSEELSGMILPRTPLRTVLLNLVSNAIKHHDRPEGRISVSAREEGERLVFTVSDDGPGIAPDYREKVFGIFQTLRPRDEVEGSGMGLAIVRKHVTLAGGEITLASNGERGCSFRFTWPKPEPTERGGQAA